MADLRSSDDDDESESEESEEEEEEDDDEDDEDCFFFFFLRPGETAVRCFMLARVCRSLRGTVAITALLSEHVVSIVSGRSCR